MNAAGAPGPEPKTACALLEEIQAGNPNPDPELPAPAPETLTEGQRQAVEAALQQPQVDEELLVARITEAAPLAPVLRSGIAKFFRQLPTQAEQRRDLAFALMQAGPLAQGQQELLFGDFRRQFEWQQAVGQMYIATHRVKFPWSGEYSAPGSPFWWIFEYLFQPLVATTFAMLAFYVASAAFRAFRAKNLEALLLLGTAFIILLGRTFAGYYLTSWIPDSLSALRIDQMTIYIMGIFATAGNRAIMIGIALGIASTSLKVLLGIDRSYLGSND